MQRIMPAPHSTQNMRTENLLPTTGNDDLIPLKELLEDKGIKDFSKKISFLGKVIQERMPTTEPSQHFNKSIYFRTAEEIAGYRATKQEAHLLHFIEICEILGITPTVVDIEDGKKSISSYSMDFQTHQTFLRAGKNLFKLISRMIESLSLVQGQDVAINFVKFLCESAFPKSKIAEFSRDLRRAREFWIVKAHPEVQRRPLIERAATFLPKKGNAAVYHVQDIIDLCRNDEEIARINAIARNNVGTWAESKETQAHETQAPTATAAPTKKAPEPLLFIKAEAQIPGSSARLYLSPCSSIQAVRNYTKQFGQVFGLLNFANAYRVGGGFLGAGRVQEEGLFQRTTIFSAILGEIKTGAVIFRPEFRTSTRESFFHEGEYTKQLEYAPERTAEIHGQRDFLVANPAQLHDQAFAVVIRDDLARPLPEKEFAPFIELRAALKDRNPRAHASSKTEAEKEATVATNALRTEAELQTYTAEEQAEVTQTIHIILRTAQAAGLRHLILGAIGCGAFKHPPLEVAAIFKECLEQEEFRNAFDAVVFAIPDERSRNYRAFKEVLFAAEAPTAAT